MVVIWALPLTCPAQIIVKQGFEDLEGLTFSNSQGGYHTKNPRMEIVKDAKESKGALHITFDNTGEGDTGGACYVSIPPVEPPTDIREAVVSLKVKRGVSIDSIQIDFVSEIGREYSAYWSGNQLPEPDKWALLSCRIKAPSEQEQQGKARGKITTIHVKTGNRVPFAKDNEAWFDDLKIEVLE